MKSVMVLVQSLPPELQDLFTARTFCARCNRVETVVSSSIRRQCEFCGGALEMRKFPVLMFNNPGETIGLHTGLGAEQYVLNGVFSAKREGGRPLVYTILVDFQFIQKQELFVLNAIPESQQRQVAEELTFLKVEKVKQYLQCDKTSQIWAKLGRPQLLCYFQFAALNGLVQQNVQSVMEVSVRPEVEVLPSPESPVPLTLPDIQVPHFEPLNSESTDKEESVEESRARIEQLPQRPKRAQIRDWVWILYVVLGVSALFFIISIILMGVIFHRLNTTLRVDGIIIKDKIFNTKSVKTRRDAEKYVPGETTVSKTSKMGPGRLGASGLASGMYLDNLEADYIYSNVSDIVNLYAGAATCDVTLNPADYTNISVPRVRCANLTADVVNGPSLTVNKSANLDPHLIIEELSVKNLTTTNLECATMNSTNATSLADYNIESLTTKDQARVGALESPTVETSELFESRNVNGTRSTLNRNEPGCKYWSSGQLSGLVCNLTNSVFDAT